MLKPLRRSTWFCSRLLVPIVLAVMLLGVSTQGQGQSLPGLSKLETSNDASPESAPGSRTGELIELLKDDAARQELISELEARRDAETGSEIAAQAPPSNKPFLSRYLGAIKSWYHNELPAFVARLERVPTTLQLAQKGLTTQSIEAPLTNGLMTAVVCYLVVLCFHFMFRPLYNRLNVKGEGAGWLRLLWLRSLVTALSLVTLVLAMVAAIIFVIYRSGGGEDVGPGYPQFLTAFYYVEVARVIVRFLISYNRPNLRLVSIPDRAARTMQRATSLVIVFVGYGQLFLVPIVEEATSVFFARAVATLIGSVGVLILLGVVLANRRNVAAWLREKAQGKPFEETIDGLVDRWHYPVVGYLLLLFIVVLTSPGNVLLPLLWTSGLAIGTLLIGLITIEMLDRSGRQSIRLPKFVSYRLPMLESRLNRMVPALLNIIRVAVLCVIGAVIANIVGVFDLDGFLESDFGAWGMSALASAFLIIVMLYLAYIVMASWVDYKLNPFVGEVPTSRTVTLLTLMRNAIAVAILVVGVMVVLAELGMNIGPLLASAGVLGLAFSFGAQKMVEDIITGVFIQFENAMNVGDVVNVGGVIGTVEKLTVRSVTLRDVQGVVHMIPFSTSSMVSNYMREYSYYVCDMGVAYREDVSEVKQAMLDAFEELRADPEHGKFLLEDLEWMGLDAFGDSALVVRARIKTVPGEQWGIKRAYNGYLKTIFDARDIEIPFPHQTLYFGVDKDGRAPAARVVVEQEDRGAGRGRTEEPEVPEPRS